MGGSGAARSEDADEEAEQMADDGEDEAEKRVSERENVVPAMGILVSSLSDM